MSKPGAPNDLVTHNLLGKTRPVRVRMTVGDYDAVHEQSLGDPDAIRLARLTRALGRVLSPRYVAEVGLVPGTSTSSTLDRRFAVTLRRYVGKRLDPTALFVVRGDREDAPLAAYLDALSMPSLMYGERVEPRVTITLPEKALRRCASKPVKKLGATTATTSLDVHSPIGARY